MGGEAGYTVRPFRCLHEVWRCVEALKIYMHVSFYLQSLSPKALSTSPPAPTADVKGDRGLPLSFSVRVPQGQDGSRVGKSQEGTS